MNLISKWLRESYRQLASGQKTKVGKIDDRCCSAPLFFFQVRVADGNRSATPGSKKAPILSCLRLQNCETLTIMRLNFETTVRLAIEIQHSKEPQGPLLLIDIRKYYRKYLKL